jgi:phospholipid/cholesterol/gamma-HCH transport system substrate-binding protein
MNRNRTELKVGIFVLFCLGVLLGLVLQFSKGTTLLRHTYNIVGITSEVGGLRSRASVLLSGVQVGTISQITLSSGSTNVVVTMKIYSDYVIRTGSAFVIEQSGFLGDQFIAVYPSGGQGPPLADGAVVSLTPPFNMLGVARDVAGFVQRLDETATNLDGAINDVRRQVLNQETLTNIAATVGTLQHISESAATVVSNLDYLIQVDTAPVGAVISNLDHFALQLQGIAGTAQNLLDTNQAAIAVAVSNLQASSAMLTNILSGTEHSKGLVGELLYDQQLSSNIEALASNLAVASGNLRSNGLWRFLWRPKTPPEPATKKSN